jgi:hypothetical protein
LQLATRHHHHRNTPSAHVSHVAVAQIQRLQTVLLSRLRESNKMTHRQLWRHQSADGRVLVEGKQKIEQQL